MKNHTDPRAAAERAARLEARIEDYRHERNEAIVERYAAGETLEAIGTDYGLSRERVRQIAKRLRPDLDPKAIRRTRNRAEWTCAGCGLTEMRTPHGAKARSHPGPCAVAANAIARGGKRAMHMGPAGHYVARMRGIGKTQRAARVVAQEALGRMLDRNEWAVLIDRNRENLALDNIAILNPTEAMSHRDRTLPDAAFAPFTVAALLGSNTPKRRNP
jgi:hypothetical protein